jgi:hypothetical protein
MGGRNVNVPLFPHWPACIVMISLSTRQYRVSCKLSGLTEALCAEKKAEVVDSMLTGDALVGQEHGLSYEVLCA